jgi:hypothetical protein
MCNGKSSRTSQGGTIVVLQSTLPSPRPQLKRELSLRLSADVDNGQTIATFDGLESHLGGSHFVIQFVNALDLPQCIIEMNSELMHPFTAEMGT